MKQITILSGKGGVGKSSITASLAIALSKQKKVICADCDVDASNLALVFGIKEDDYDNWTPITTNEKARFDRKKCTSCKKCADACYFNAIAWDSKTNTPIFKEFGCEGCGVCELICPKKAIELYDVMNAKIGCGTTKYGFPVVSGQLEMGESGSGKVVFKVRELAKKTGKDRDIMLIDAAAGIGCPVIASVVGSDHVIGICEPTPSGFADLKRALSVVSHFNIAHSIIINKYDLNKEYSKKIEQFAKENNIKILSKIKYDKSFTDALTNLTPLIIFNPAFEQVFKEIITGLENENALGSQPETQAKE